MAQLIGWFLVSIVFSFLCSVWEAVLLSITPAYTQIMSKDDTPVSRLLVKFKSNIDRPLAAILTLNTIAHTVGAIGVGASAAQLWPDRDMTIIPGRFSLSYETIVAVIMTLAILILSEIIPKTIGANYWKRLTGFTVRCLNVVIYILYPLVMLSQLITRTLKKDKKKSVLSRSDISAIADIGMESGIIREDENRIFKNLMDFHSITAEDVMTPRTVVMAAQEDMSITEFYQANPVLRYSRIPVHSGSMDELTGYVLKDEMLASLIQMENDSRQLKDIKREMMVITENALLPKVLDQMTRTKEHIAQVVDEYGGTAGVLTMEDIIETLLGLEILDEMDVTADMQKLAKDRWQRLRKKRLSDTQSS